MAFADTQKLVVELDLKGNLTQGLAKVTRDLRSFDKATSNTQKSLHKFAGNIGKGVTIGAAAIATGAAVVVHAASDYESAFAGVRKTVNATEPQLQELSKQFREMSKTIPIAAADLARLGEAGGALGVPTDQLKEFVRVTALLGVTTNLTADEAANSLGVLGNVLHLTGEDYSRFASSLVALGNAGASTEADIVAIAQRAGAAGHLIGESTQEILGFASATASLGIEAEAGGTALQKFFIDSAKFIAKGGKELKEFAKVAGVSAKTFQKEFAKDSGKALQQFLAGLGKLKQADQLKVLEDLGFNDARITRTLLGLANNTALVSDQMNIANQAFKDNTALTKEADQRFNTFASQLQITKNTLTDIAITIGSKLLPKLTPLLKELNAFIGSHQADIEKFGDDLANAFQSIADAVGKTDWTPFVDGLRISAQLAKNAFDVFNALPAEFKAIILVGAGINKVTGGLITSIGKDLFSGLGDQFLKRGSSPANPLFVSAVGGLGGQGGGGSGPGGVPLGAAAAGAAGFLAAQQAAQGLNSQAAQLVGISPEAADQIGKAAAYALPGPPILQALNNINPALDQIKAFLSGGDKNQGTLDPASRAAVQQTAAAAVHTNERLEAIKAQEAAQTAKADALNASVSKATAQDSVNAAIANSKAQSIAQAAAATAAAVKTTDPRQVLRERLAAVQSKIADGTSETRAVAAAVRAKKLSVTTNVSVQTKVSVQNIVKQTGKYKSYYNVAS